MASIHGISIKGLKTFLGHEGETCYQGNLYIGNKKLGFWSQNSWGGSDDFDFEIRDMVQRLNKKVIELNQDKALHGTSYNGKPYTVDYGLEQLMYDLLKLQMDEKEFKSALKKGYSGIMVVTDGYHMVMWNLKEPHTKLTDEALIKLCSKMIEDAKADAKFYKEDKRTKHEIKIYRSLSDFEIGEKISLAEIKKEKTVDEKVAEAKLSKGSSKKNGKEIER